MKKILSLLLFVMLMLSASITVFAETVLDAGTYSGTVTGTYVAGNDGFSTVFCVDIEWQNLEFTYNAEKEPVWDPQTHTYSEAVAADWDGMGTITVTNHSNAPISAVPSFIADSGYDSVAMTFSTVNLHLPSSEFMTFSEDIHQGAITVTPRGSLSAGTNNQTIGSVTISLAEDFNNVSIAEAEALLEKAQALIYEASTYNTDDPNNNAFDKTYSILQNATAALRTIIGNAVNYGELDQVNLSVQYQTSRGTYYELLSLLNAKKAAN